MKLTLILTFSILFLASCGEIIQQSKIEITPGCYLYKYSNDLNIIYTTICDTDKQEQTSYAESCGKGCTRNVEIKTIHTPIIN